MRRLELAEGNRVRNVLHDLCGVRQSDDFVLEAQARGFKSWKFQAFPEHTGVALVLDANFELTVSAGVIREQASEQLQRAREALRGLNVEVRAREAMELRFHPEPRLRQSPLC